jgi:hypothetical protein
VRRAAACLLLLSALLVSGCGSSKTEKRRDAVNDYLGRVDRIQQRYAPSFQLANDAYRDFSKGKGGKRQLERLRGAEVSILAARTALRELKPPADARRLHRDLLQLYDVNAQLGLEVITLQQFLPGVRRILGGLARVNASYREDLAATTSSTEQAIALDGYAAAIGGVKQKLQRLAAPSALRPWQRSQVTRLRQIVETGRTLAASLRLGDRAAVAALIKRFRFLLAHQPNVSQAQHDAVKAYDERLIGLTKLQGRISAEHQRLQNLLG